MATASDRRSFLIYLHRKGASATPVVSLSDTLGTCLDTLGADIETGRVLTSATRDGFSVTYGILGNNLGPARLFAEIGRMIEEHDAAEATLIAAGNDTPTDLQIRNEMLLRKWFTPVREVTSDFSSLTYV